MSESAFSADDFGDVDWSQYDIDLGDGDGIPEVEVDGETYQFPTREQERAALAAELQAGELEKARDEIRGTWPDMPPKVVELLAAEDGDSLRDLAATVAHRLGLTRSDAADHPGAGPSRAQQLPGANALEKARSAARQGDVTPYMSLKDAAAFAASGAPLTPERVERVRYAMNFARQVGDTQAVEFLARQLGEGR